MDPHLKATSTRRMSFDKTSTAPVRAVPPPITASIYLPARSRPPSQLSGTFTTKPRPWYHRKAAQLEADLQLLLDAQATHLLDPLSTPPPSSTASTTSDPFSRSASRTGLLPTDPSQISLRAARAGLYNNMRRLAALKDDELNSTSAAASSAAEAHEQLTAWDTKKEKLRSRAEEIAAGPDTAKAQDLKNAAEQLQPEITELEDRLAKLRNEQRRLHREADEAANKTEARLSALTRELDNLDKRTKEFLVHLQRGSEGVVFDAENEDRNDTEDDRAFWRLAPKRRTLEMARDVLGRERERAEERLQASGNEKEALIHGAIVWKDVVKLVEGFEKALRSDMADADSARDDANQRLQDTLTAMDGVVEQLEGQLRLVEARGWKLLIAAIGAELDAFTRGRLLLRQTLGLDQDETTEPLVDGEGEDEPGVTSVIRAPPAQRVGSTQQDSHDGVLEELDHAFERGRNTSRSHDTDEDEDDGPDPELMISHHDTDTD